MWASAACSSAAQATRAPGAALTSRPPSRFSSTSTTTRRRASTRRRSPRLRLWRRGRRERERKKGSGPAGRRRPLSSTAPMGRAGTRTATFSPRPTSKHSSTGPSTKSSASEGRPATEARPTVAVSNGPSERDFHGEEQNSTYVFPPPRSFAVLIFISPPPPPHSLATTAVALPASTPGHNNITYSSRPHTSSAPQSPPHFSRTAAVLLFTYPPPEQQHARPTTTLLRNSGSTAIHMTLPQQRDLRLDYISSPRPHTSSPQPQQLRCPPPVRRPFPRLFGTERHLARFSRTSV
mmetsp:Transcript_24855/g.76746  ORF Transcript_24855/g.76746 Transcript_24855/m.76746 type:complete len:293 (-) Transcript_24855:44-922(-)